MSELRLAETAGPGHPGASTTPPPPRWWLDDTSVTFRAVVPDVDTVGPQLIPYARIGGRSPKAYAAHYRSWSDVAGQKITDLLTHRGAGVRTVEQLIDAGRDAVAANRMAQMRRELPLGAAVQELLSRLDPHDRTVLECRLWAAEPVPRDQLERELGVGSRVSERQQTRARRRFQELLTEPLHRLVAARAYALGSELGPYVPASMVSEQLKAMGVDPASETARVLLFIAGPYTPRGDWFENRSLGGRRAVVADVDAVFAENPAPRLRALAAAVAQHHMPAAVVPALMDSLPVRRFGAAYVRWGSTPAMQIAAFLRSVGHPLTPEEVVDGIGDGYLTPVRARETLINLQNKRLFARASKSTWGLREWGAPEYRGIAEAIRERIAAAGGSAPAADTAAELVATFPDISARSVQSYMQSWAFVTEDGMIRVRTDHDPLPKVRHWRRTRGVFAAGDGKFNVLRPVTSELLRGTSATAGRLAGALGVAPGGRETFTGPDGNEVTVSWLLDAPGAPHIGSLRGMALSAGAAEGDSIVLTFTPAERTVTVTRLPARTPVLETLKRVTNKRTVTKQTVAASLECAVDDAADVLVQRGDDALGRAVAALRRQ